MGMIPAEAQAKIEANERDFYGNLSDEEREAEGLPPRDEPKPVAEAKVAVEEQSDQKSDEQEAEGEPDQEGASLDDLLEEVAALREDLTSAMGKPEPEAREDEDPLIAAARDHDDPVVQRLAERLERAEKNLAAQQKATSDFRREQQLLKDNAAFNAVQKGYIIDGKPLTDAHIEAVEDYILKNPEIGSRLSIEQLTRIVHPNAVRAQKAPKKIATPKDDGPVATVVEEGGTGNSPKESWKPRPNEDISSAVRAAGQRFRWVP